MATRKTRTLAIKAKVWGTDSIMEFDGGLSEGIRYSFMYLPEKKRADLMEAMAKDHAELIEHAKAQHVTTQPKGEA